MCARLVSAGLTSEPGHPLKAEPAHGARGVCWCM